MIRIFSTACAITCWLMLTGLGGAFALPALPPGFGPDTMTADLGRLAVGESRVHRFVFTNNTPEILRVRAVETSCDCMTVTDYPHNLAPGAGAPVIVRVFAEKPGDFAFAAAIELEDGGQRFFVTMTTVVPAVSDAAEPPPLAPRRLASAWRPGTPSPIDPEVLRRVTQTRDRSLYRLLDDQVMEEISKGMWRVVDLRGADAFSAQTIPGALNLPASAMPVTAFLHQGRVLLVDEGWGTPATERACIRLRQAGNPACAILWGGLAAWAGQGGELVGTAPSPEALRNLTAREFLGVRGFDDWIVAYTSTNPAPIEALLHEAVPLPQARPNPWTRVLLIDGDRTVGSAALPETLVFRLSGGWPALAREFRDMTAMRHSREMTTTRRVTGRRWEILRSGCGCK